MSGKTLLTVAINTSPKERNQPMDVCLPEIGSIRVSGGPLLVKEPRALIGRWAEGTKKKKSLNQ